MIPSRTVAETLHHQYLAFSPAMGFWVKNPAPGQEPWSASDPAAGTVISQAMLGTGRMEKLKRSTPGGLHLVQKDCVEHVSMRELADKFVGEILDWEEGEVIAFARDELGLNVAFEGCDPDLPSSTLWTCEDMTSINQDELAEELVMAMEGMMPSAFHAMYGKRNHPLVLFMDPRAMAGQDEAGFYVVDQEKCPEAPARLFISGTQALTGAEMMNRAGVSHHAQGL